MARGLSLNYRTLARILDAGVLLLHGERNGVRRYDVARLEDCLCAHGRLGRLLGHVGEGSRCGSPKLPPGGVVHHHDAGRRNGF